MSAACVGLDARLRAYRAGGIATHVHCLIDGLAQLDPPERIVILAHRREGAAARTEVAPIGRDDDGRRQFRTRRLFTPPHHRLEGVSLPLELYLSPVQLLHATDFVLPRLWRGPGVVTVHDLAFLRHPALVTHESARYYRQVHRSVRSAMRVITVSEHTRRELIALTDVAPERVRVIPNAVQAAFAAPPDPEVEAEVVARRGVREPFLLFVSTIEPRKNVTTLLAAFRRVLDSGHDVDLALVGQDGWHSNEVYALARELDLASRAHFLGYVPTGDLVAFYRRAAALAHPALDEGFGIAPLEAMASGTPAVVADAGAVPEVTGDAALLVSPTDVAGWALALAHLLDDPASARERAEAGRRRAAAFTPLRMAAETLAVYREAWSEARGVR